MMGCSLLFYLVDRAGFEPATSCLSGKRSNLLNYRSFLEVVANRDDSYIQSRTFFTLGAYNFFLFFRERIHEI